MEVDSLPPAPLAASEEHVPAAVIDNAGPSVSADAPASDEVAPSHQGGALANSLSYAWASSLSLYGALRDKAYDRSTLLNYSIDKLEDLAKKSQPYAQRLYTSVEPTVAALDTKVTSLVDTVSAPGAVKASLSGALPEGWAEKVDVALANKWDARQSFDYFVSTVTVAYLQLADAAAATRDTVVRYDEAVIRAQLARVWDTRLAAAAEGTFAAVAAAVAERKAQIAAASASATAAASAAAAAIPRTDAGSVDVPELAAQLRQQLASAYEATVVEVFRAHVASPATAVYNVAVEQFDKLRASVAPAAVEGKEEAKGDSAASDADAVAAAPGAAHGAVPTVTSFLAAVRARLGATYSTALEAPLREFYTAAVEAVSVRGTQLKEMAAVLRFDDAGRLTLHDVYFSSLSAYQHAKAYVTGSVAGAYASVATKTADTYAAVKTRAADTIEAVKTRTADGYNALVTRTASVVDRLIPDPEGAAAAESPNAVAADSAAASEGQADVSVVAEGPALPPVEGSATPSASPSDASAAPASASAAPASLTAVGFVARARVLRRLRAHLSTLRSASEQHIASLRTLSSTRGRALTGIDVVERAEATIKGLETALAASSAAAVTAAAPAAAAAAQATAAVTAAQVQASAAVSAAHAQATAAVDAARAQASAAAGAVHESLSSRYAAGAAALRASLDAVRSSLAAVAVASAASAPAQTVQARVTALEPTLAELRARLDTALVSARALAAASGEYVLHTQFATIGVDARAAAAAAAAKARGASVEEAAPESAAVVAGAANVAALLSAVKGVFFWDAAAAAAPEVGAAEEGETSEEDADAAAASAQTEETVAEEAVAENPVSAESEPVIAAEPEVPVAVAAEEDAQEEAGGEEGDPLAPEDAAILDEITTELEAVSALPAVQAAAAAGKEHKKKKGGSRK